jgi:hypothetical protein
MGSILEGRSGAGRKALEIEEEVERMKLMKMYFDRIDVENTEEDTYFVDVGYCMENLLMIMQV